MMFSDAIKMGAYGAYVWSCYGLTLAGIVYLLVATHLNWQSELKQARRRAQAAQVESKS